MNYSECISYLLGTISKIPNMFNGLSFYKNGGLSEGKRIFENGSSHVDFSKSSSQLYDALGCSFWFGLIIGVISNILSAVGSIGSIYSSISVVIGYAISLAILGYIVNLSEKANCKWGNTIVQIVAVCLYISMVAQVINVFWSAIQAIMLLVGGFNVMPALSSVLTIVSCIFALCCDGVMFSALLQGTPVTTFTKQNNSNS